MQESRVIVGYRFTSIKRLFRKPKVGIQIQWKEVGTYSSYDGGMASERDYDQTSWYDADVEDLMELTTYMANQSK